MRTIGERTKLLRKALNLTQVELSGIIGMSQGNISDIEKNNINYSFDALISLYRYLLSTNISLNWFFVGEGEMYQCSGNDIEEKEINELFNGYIKLGEVEKGRVLERIQTLLELKRENTKKPLLKPDKVTEFTNPRAAPEWMGEGVSVAEPVAKSNVLSSVNYSNNSNSLVHIKVYDLKNSTDIINYLCTNQKFEVLQFNSVDVSDRTDFGIRIPDDCMKPEIAQDGIAWVEECVRVGDGELGIFVYKGEAYCRRLYIDRLNSMIYLRASNYEYPSIRVDEYESLRTVGRVII